MLQKSLNEKYAYAYSLKKYITFEFAEPLSSGQPQTD